MLLLKEGTSLFSDFGGIIQKRFTHNISEKVIEIRRDLIAAGCLMKPIPNRTNDRTVAGRLSPADKQLVIVNGSGMPR